MTYLLLGASLLFVAIAVRALAEIVARRRGHTIPVLPTILAAAVLVTLTAVFDNVIIAADFFAYSDPHISGVRIGLAPIEDFSYPLALGILLPGVWDLLGRGRRDAD